MGIRRDMGRLFKNYLEGNVLYSCSQCKTHLALHDNLISTSFHGRTGRAFLFEKVANAKLGPLEERIFTTGLHSVCDIYCICCHNNIGWYYKEVGPTLSLVSRSFMVDERVES